MKKLFLFLLCLSITASLFSQLAGENDLSFNPMDLGNGFGDGANGIVNTIAVQEDGKIILGGSFTHYNNMSSKHIVRLNTNGTIDESFNIGIGFDDFVNSIKIQADGKILVGGKFTILNGVTIENIVRLNQDGTVDPSFNLTTSINGYVYSISIQDDNNILIGGSFVYNTGHFTYGVARLSTNGNLDPTFTIQDGANAIVLTTSIQNNGKLLIGGNFTTFNGIPCGQLVQLNADGTIDSTFDIGSGFNYPVYCTLFQDNNKPIICGEFTQFNGSGVGEIVRLNEDGALDPNFTNDLLINGPIKSVAIQNDGKIIIGGNFTLINGLSANYLARLNIDGTIDPLFNIENGVNNQINTCIIQSDEKILIGGDFTAINGKLRSFCSRLNVDGALDLSHNYGSASNNSIAVTALQTDGKILIGGDFTSYNDIPLNHIARLNSDGSIDETFNVGVGTNNDVSAICIQPDGKILIAGSFTQFNNSPRKYIVRLNSDGSIDNSFQIGSGPSSHINAMAIQHDGKILIGGNFDYYNGVFKGKLARLNQDGSLDLTLNTGTGFNSIVFSISIQDDGKIICGGLMNFFNGAQLDSYCRLNHDGSLDQDFNLVNTFGLVKSTLVQKDGKILIGGTILTNPGTESRNLFRFNVDGNFDDDFKADFGSNGKILTIAQQVDGKLIIGGDFNTINGVEKNDLVRLNEDGSLDETFAIGNGSNFSVYDVNIQNDGKLIVSGYFTSFNGIGRNRLTRLESESPFVMTTPLIYPNPNAGVFNLELDSASEIQIYTVTGELVYNQTFESGKHSITFDHPANGLYLLNVLQADENYSVKFVKYAP
jgi:uncharacterized delta-60 repeat protein